MNVDLAALVAADHSALLINEMQANIVGRDDALGAAATGIVPSVAGLCAAARLTGVPVLHCVKVFRRDGVARNRNTPLYRRMGVSTEAHAADSRAEPGCVPIAELGPDERDLVMTRLHGMGAATETGVVPVLRNLGVTTVVVVGLSLNVGILNTAMDLMNHGFEVVVPADAVTGVPEDYAAAVIKYTVKAIATVTTTEALVAAWSAV
jgi:biuret amidohydrolase